MFGAQFFGHRFKRVGLKEALKVVVVTERKAPGENCIVLDPVGIPIEHIAVNVHRALHHLFDDLHVVAQLLALNKVNLDLAGGALVDQLGEHRVAAIKHRADRIGTTQRQCGLCVSKRCEYGCARQQSARKQRRNQSFHRSLPLF